MTASPPTLRTWVALGPAQTLFAAVFSVSILTALPFIDQPDTWETLGDFFTLLLAGAVAVAVGVPVAVHTVGRYTARLTDGWPRWRAALIHLVVGAGLGALAAAMVVVLGAVPVPAAALALVPPSGLAACGTSLLLPLALRHRWLRTTAWALGAGAVGFALLFVFLGLFGGI